MRLYRVKELISLFSMMGCEEAWTTTPKAQLGAKYVEHVHYLKISHTGKTANLGDLDPDDRVPWSVAQSWSRRLDIRVPPPPEEEP